MIDLRLRFPTRTDAIAAMPDMTTTDESGEVRFIAGSHQYALDDIGEISGRDGYHINLRILDDSMDVSALAQYEVFPANPARVWA